MPVPVGLWNKSPQDPIKTVSHHLQRAFLSLIILFSFVYIFILILSLLSKAAQFLHTPFCPLLSPHIYSSVREWHLNYSRWPAVPERVAILSLSSSLAHQLLDKVMASVQHFIGFIFMFSLKLKKKKIIISLNTSI